ncbi:hypothetical protein N7491_000749 [Penicillium cf. griseofulvum]|uniref:Uncharacterized protein n=1 Tax=Penicillium cf. griseofulvum TaxID=2972120 RepID=A0A9W9LXV4_9EURO|nr:hypothetical protein N7472_011154 [Penicillium cf. griseofulvum]KAJ5442909.1 hypothetical protein N7445_004660 [Penicillium cf. griseofulvum]KAJ5451567.1 hypothetical protein N7491_000749 [Penicillium cf. griseofulvum]
MTQAVQMKQQTENLDSMFPDSGSVDNMASETHVRAYQSLDPSHSSLEDYNRSMLQYTQRQMSSFVDMDDPRRGSQSSGKSGFSNAASGSSISRQTNGSFTSAGNVENKLSGRDTAEAKSHGY